MCLSVPAHRNFPSNPSQFKGIASEIIAVVEGKEKSIYSVMEEFSTMLTSSAMALNQVWPKVSIPDFERRGQASLKASGGRFLGVTVEAPGGSYEAVNDWLYFLQNESKWYYEGCDIAGVVPGSFEDHFSTGWERAPILPPVEPPASLLTFLQ